MALTMGFNLRETVFSYSIDMNFAKMCKSQHYTLVIIPICSHRGIQA